MNIINKTNRSAFKDTAYGLISAGELYFSEQQLDPMGMSKDVTIQLPDTTKKLELKGEVPEGEILITKDGKISLFIKNNRYCITKGLEDKDITVTEDVENCKLPDEENNGGGSKEPVEVLKGDANNDGVLDMYDKKYVLDLVASNFAGLTDEEMASLIARADMDGDGYVSEKDAANIEILVKNSGWVATYANPHTYNGTELPGLPDWDEATYPYVIITKGDDFSPYYLSVISLEPCIIESSETYLLRDKLFEKVPQGQMIDYTLNEYGEWEAGRAVSFRTLDMTKYPLVWTNTDIYYEEGYVDEALANIIYMAASDPIPVS